MAMLLLPQGPLSTRYSAALLLTFIAVTLLSRNLNIIAGAVFVLNIATRFLFPISSWHDQHWVQWSSVSAVITGHNILDTPPLIGMSWSNYMPMGDLFGGVFIALGIQQYWQIWHVIVVCLFILPYLFSPSLNTLLIFIGTTCYYGFNDYTTGGGTLEIGVATTIAAIAMYRAGLHGPSLIMFAFAAQFRQPAIMLVPFLGILLWRKRDIRGAVLFGVSLLFFGGFFLILNPAGAYRTLYKVWDKYHQELFNYVPGLNQNYSISSLPHVFGFSDTVPWTQWTALYMPLTLIAIGVLFFLAWRSPSRDTVLCLAVLATVFVYLFSRGYAQYHYVLSAAFPFAALLYPSAGPFPHWPKAFGAALAGLIFWIGALPAVWLFVFSILHAAAGDAKTVPVPIAHAFEVTESGATTEIPIPNGDNSRRHVFPLTSSLEVKFDMPAKIASVRLSGDHVSLIDVKGVPLLYATETEMRGIVTEGEIDYAEAGGAMKPLLQFTNPINYNAYPATIALPRTATLITSLRVKPKSLYLDHKEWILGNVEFFARR